MDLLDRPVATTAPTLMTPEISSTTAPTEVSGTHRIAVFRKFEKALDQLASELFDGKETPIAAKVIRPAWDVYLWASECAPPECSIEIFSYKDGGLTISCQNAKRSRRVKLSLRPESPGMVRVSRISLKLTNHSECSLPYLNLPREMEWLESSVAAMVPATY